MSDEWDFENEEYVDRTIPENKIVRAKLTEVKKRETPYTNREGKPDVIRKLEWWWEVITPNEAYTGRSIKGECDQKMSMHPNNKFRLWSEALLGRELGIGEKVDPREFVGVVAEVTVMHEANKKNPSIIYERVDDVIPLSTVDAPPF